jgi:hypothetical protein
MRSDEDGNTRAVPVLRASSVSGTAGSTSISTSVCVDGVRRYEIEPGRSPRGRPAIIRPGHGFGPTIVVMRCACCRLGAEPADFERDGLPFRAPGSDSRGARPPTPAHEPTQLASPPFRRGSGVRPGSGGRARRAEVDDSRRAVRDAGHGCDGERAPLSGLAGARSRGATVEVRPGMEAFAPTIVTVVRCPQSTGRGRAPSSASSASPRTACWRSRAAAHSPKSCRGRASGAAVVAARWARTGDAVTLLSIGWAGGWSGQLRRGLQTVRRAVVDCVARVEVRHVGAPDVIG